MLVESLIDKKLTPGHGAVSIQSFVAGHLQFRSEVEGRVGIDQQQRMMPGRVRRRDSHTVRSARFFFNIDVIVPRGPVATARGTETRCGRIAVERLQLVQINRFDVATNAAFAEGQGHPWFEMLDDSRLYLRMFGEI